MAEDFEIRGVSVAPGEHKSVRLEVAKLPTGTLIDVPVHVFRAEAPGPTLLVQGGLHGDEVNGVEIVRRMLRRRAFAEILRGAVIAVPVMNVFGFIHFSRELPDGKDINRSFPGSKRGSLASRVAYHYMRDVLPLVDAAVDLHTGGDRRSNSPQVRFTQRSPGSRELAEAFAAPFVMPSKLIAKSFREATHKLGIPAIVYEVGESLRLHELGIEEGVCGVLRVMHYLGMIPEAPIAPHTRVLQRARWLRAPRAGLFQAVVKNGSAVTKGQVIGHLTDPFGQTQLDLLAPQTGWIITLNRLPVVNQGDAVARIGR